MIDEKTGKDAFEAGFRKGFVLGAEERIKILATIFEKNSQNDKLWSPSTLEIFKFCSECCLDHAPIVDKIIKRILDETEIKYNLIWQADIQK